MLDLNLLRVMNALFEHRNVSAAARALRVSQPSISLSLRRLRDHFDDDLFVRQGGAMQPTLVAERMRASVENVMSTIQSDIAKAGPFDPATSDRNFTINLSDIGELVFLPDLIEAILRHAPNATIESVVLAPAALRTGLSDGSVDLAIGHLVEFPGDNFCEQTLFQQGFVCLARRDHPSIGDSLTLDAFLSLHHAVIVQDGQSQAVFEARLRELNFKRRITLRSPHFMSVPLLLARTDMIAVVPLAVGRIYAQLADLQMRPLPFDVPAVPLKQTWHRRAHGDPGSIWLRQMVANLFLGRDPTDSLPDKALSDRMHQP